MGLFNSAPKVYKPAAEFNLGPDSDEHYISPNVKAPLVARILVKIFAWVLLVSEADIPEPPLFTAPHSWQGADIPEQKVNLTKPGSSPAELVQEAIRCLPAELVDPSSGFRRWTIRDFFKACHGWVLQKDY